ncbi:S-adenosyl-L-methionine-dependent methyltransferase, partial [Tribonema minus]
LTYGEFDLDFLKLILDKHDPGPGTRFMDVGSGTGRCTLAAALLRPSWALCTGLEILPEMTAYAREVHAALLSSCGSSSGAPLARCEFVTADMYSSDGGDAASATAADYDLLFAYSTAWPSDVGDSPLYLRRLSRALAARLTVGAVVVTVDKRLRAEDGFELVMAYEGENRETGESTAYV